MKILVDDIDLLSGEGTTSDRYRNLSNAAIGRTYAGAFPPPRANRQTIARPTNSLTNTCSPSDTRQKHLSAVLPRRVLRFGGRLQQDIRLSHAERARPPVPMGRHRGIRPISGDACPGKEIRIVRFAQPQRGPPVAGVGGAFVEQPRRGDIAGDE